MTIPLNEAPLAGLRLGWGAAAARAAAMPRWRPQAPRSLQRAAAVRRARHARPASPLVALASEARRAARVGGPKPRLSAVVGQPALDGAALPAVQGQRLAAQGRQQLGLAP